VKLVVVVALAGCLTAPTTPTPICTKNDDCDTAHGEVCDEGMCWGNPPPGPFLVAVTPPSDRDLAPTETVLDSIPANGYAGDLALDNPVSFAGRVEAFCATSCTHASVAATITIARPSKFPGGAGFHLQIPSKPDLTDISENSFKVSLPPTLAGDAMYTVTIVPDGRGDMPTGTITPAQLVPPTQLQLQLDGTGGPRLVTLGAATLPVIDGFVQTSIGVKLPHHRVVALGHWDKDAPFTEVSTVAYTDTSGHYAITLSAGLVGNIDIVAKSYDPDPAPVLHVGAVPVTTASINISQPASIGGPVNIPVTIRGVNGDGEVVPVDGASVIVTAQTTPSFPQTAFSIVTAQATTGADGTVVISLVDSPAYNTIYKLGVIPPQSSSFSVIYDEDFVIGSDYSDVRLGSRLALHGVVLDADNNPAGGVAVTAQPSLKFTWSLDDDSQKFLAQIPAATAITSDDGRFVVFVDRQLGPVWGAYDLAFEPATSSHAPNFLDTSIDVLRDGRTDLVRNEKLPPAAFIKGRIVDGMTTKNPVIGGEVRVFQVPSDYAAKVCGFVMNAPPGCPIPAALLGRGTSDDVGVVRMTLPRMQP
jgi:hypothetical protein